MRIRIHNWNGKREPQSLSELNQLEIARLSKVSQATVSRVLNGDNRVNQDVRDRVLSVVKEHDYAPNVRAQALRSKRSGILGLVVHRDAGELQQDPFFSPLIVAIMQAGIERGFYLCVDTARKVRSHRSIHEELLRTRRVDGLLLVESRDYDERIEWLCSQNFPFVLIGRYGQNDKVFSVDNDNVAAGKTVTDQLICTGHRRIAFIGGPPGVNVSEDRKRGYLNSLLSHGLPIDMSLVLHGDFSSEGGVRCMRQIMHQPERPDAVIAIDDLTAASCMQYAITNGVQVPDAMGFVGFNDSKFCQFLSPTLSSVSVEIRDLARFSTGMLIDLIEGKEVNPVHKIVPVSVQMRGSTRNKLLVRTT